MIILMHLKPELRHPDQTKQETAIAAFSEAEWLYRKQTDIRGTAICLADSMDPGNCLTDGKDTPASVVNYAEAWNSTLEENFAYVFSAMCPAVKAYGAADRKSGDPWSVSDQADLYLLQKAAMQLTNHVHAFADRLFLPKQEESDSSQRFRTYLKPEHMEDVRKNPENYVILEVI